MNKDTTKGRVPELRFPEFIKTGDWEKTDLGSVLNGESSQIALKNVKFKPHGYSLYGADGFQGYIDFYEQEKEFIAIVKDGSGVGRLFFCESQSSVLGTLTYLKTKDERKFILEWLYFLLQTINFKTYVKGSGIPHIYYDDYKKEEIFIPFSRPEQQKIAACLSSLDKTIALEKEKLSTLEAHKKGLMQRLFPAEGKKVPELRFPEFRNSGDWEEKRLGDVGEFVGGGTPNTSIAEYWNGNIQWFTPSEIKSKFIEESIRKITSKGLKYSSAKLLPIGAILITTRATIGDVGIAKIKCTTNQGFQSLITNEGESNNFWYYWIIQNKQKFLRRASGSTFFEISKNEIEKVKVISPDFREQEKIARCLSYMDELIEVERKKIAQTESHKKGLMQRLFPSVKN